LVKPAVWRCIVTHALDVVELWQDFYHAVVYGDFLKIKQANAKRLPFQGNLLFLRKCYTDILTIITSSTDYSRFLLLGNPGIGKSCFLIYLLFELLQHKQTVVLRRSGDLGLCFLFQNGQVSCTANISDFVGVLNNPATWYLVDTVPDPGSVMAKTVFACSPRRDNYKLFERYQQRVTLYFPVWSYDEIIFARAPLFSDMYADTVVDRFAKVGGIPRLVFSNEDLDDKIKDALGRSSFDKCTDATGVLEGENDVSHVLIHIVADPDQAYQKHTVNFASKYIGEELVKWFEVRERQKLRSLLGMSGRVPYSGRLQGSLFEAWAHQILVRGGKFPIRRLGKNTNDCEIVIPQCMVKNVVDFTPIGGNTYYKPISDNFPCVDAWIPTVGFFQMTVSLSHPIKEAGLADLYVGVQHHDMKKFYFVIPDDDETFEKFKMQSFKRTGKSSKSKKLEDIGIYADNLEQYVLRIKVNI